jgi:hypothetical protein
VGSGETDVAVGINMEAADAGCFRRHNATPTSAESIQKNPARLGSKPSALYVPCFPARKVAAGAMVCISICLTQ